MWKTKNFDEFLNETMAAIPGSKNTTSDKQILRTAILAELDAINLYEQMAEEAKNTTVKEVLLDVAKEEKTHIGEFQALLKKLDTEYAEELKNGKEEVKNIDYKNDDDDKEEENNKKVE
jgi:rubrerythrin